MKFCICNEIFQEWPLAKQFEVAADIGFDLSMVNGLGDMLRLFFSLFGFSVASQPFVCGGQAFPRRDMHFVFGDTVSELLYGFL